MILMPYPKYREENQGWAPRLPSDWKLTQLRHIARIYAGGTPDRTNVEFWSNGTIPWLNSGSVNDWVITSPSEWISEAAASGGGTRWVPPKSVLVALAGQGKTKGMAARSEIRSTCNQSMAAIVPTKELEYRFLQFWIAANYQNVRNLAGGDLRDGLNLQHIGGIYTPVPPFKEQVAIADYLDRETAEIYAFIADQEELIAVLEERRTAHLLHLTLGRTDYAHRGPLGRFLTKLARGIQSGSEVVTAFRDGTVTGRSFRREDGFTFSESETGYQGVAVGDFVFHGLDGFSGATGISLTNGKCSPVYHVCSVGPTIEPHYAAYYFRALGISGFLGAYAWSVRQRSVDYRNWRVFSKLPVEFPGLAEQREAVERIERETAEIDAAITDAREAIALSKERRAAVISAAVTGKIDLRRALAPVSNDMEAVSVGVA